MTRTNIISVTSIYSSKTKRTTKMALIKCNLCGEFKEYFYRTVNIGQGIFCSKRCYQLSKVGLFGEKSSNWKGENAKYVAKHMWIQKRYGKATYCDNDISHQSRHYEWANISGKYLRDRNDYRQLCISCHRQMDAFRRSGGKCSKGHPHIPENRDYENGISKRCKICRRTRVNIYNKNKSKVKIENFL